MSPRSIAQSLTVMAVAIPAALAAVVEQVAAVPSSWVAVETLASESTITLTLALTMQNVDQLESMLLAVSTPSSAQYGQYYDIDGIESTFGPSSDAVSAVTSWLKASGVTAYNVNGAFVDFAASVATVNSMLNASYTHYVHNGVTKLRTPAYTIPIEVQEHIALVDPGTYYGSQQPFVPAVYPAGLAPSRSKRSTASSVTVDPSCQTSIDTACLKELYSVGTYQADPQSGSRIGYGSFLNQSTIYSDLFDYENLNGIPHQNISVEFIAGGANPQDATVDNVGEADLDVQNIVGVAHPLPVTNFITGGLPPFVPNIDQPTAADDQNEPYLPYYRYLLSQPNSALPQVITNSYGDEEDSVPYSYAVQTCNMIGLMGLRGITILESSGDLGVGAGCLAPDYKTVEFNAIFPATCPYLTSVGGTVNVTPEIAWDGSSGGFSKYFSRPAYQDLAIAEYLKTVSPSTYTYYANYTNWDGRGFPDVAAHSVSPDYAVVYDGQVYGSGGTSAASPVWAGIVGLLNDARLRAGKPALGFLNPLIYTVGWQSLNDITAGYSIGCDGMNTQSGEPEPAGSGVVPWAQWNATAGWDTTTGWGTPNFNKLKELVLIL